jgi:hypothetical protein
MELQKSLLNISELLSRFGVQVSILNSSSMLDINVVSEDFLIPVLNEIYSCNLINANHIESNYPAVDLLDQSKKITFQITSTSSAKKIRTTLEKIVVKKLYEEYDNFYIIIIGNNKENYTDLMLNTATSNKFIFTQKNVLNLKDLFANIKALTYKKISIIENYLQSQYTDSDFTNSLLNSKVGTLNKGDNSEQEKYLKSDIDSAYSIRNEWQEKKSFLELNLATVSDLDSKFSVIKKIEECTIKIQDCDDRIAFSINQLNS